MWQLKNCCFGEEDEHHEDQLSVLVDKELEGTVSAELSHMRIYIIKKLILFAVGNLNCHSLTSICLGRRPTAYGFWTTTEAGASDQHILPSCKSFPF